MKKYLLLICVIFTIMLTSCESSKNMYTEEEMHDAIVEAENDAYKRGYKEGYDLAKYENSGEIERIKNEYGNKAYQAGYDVGYEDGYSDGLEAS